MFFAQLIKDGRGWHRDGDPFVAGPFFSAMAAAEATFAVTESVVTIASRGDSDPRLGLLLLLGAAPAE